MTPRFATILLFLFFLHSLAARAQPAATAPLEKLSSANGLPDMSVNALALDEDGFLWIGTANGLSRYDGSEFVNFYHIAGDSNTIPGNTINAIQPMPGHRLVIATSTGLSLYHTLTHRFTNLLIPASPEQFPVENLFIRVVVDRHQQIWAGTPGNLYRLDTSLAIMQSFRGWGVGGLRISASGDLVARLQSKNAWPYYTFSSDENKLISYEGLPVQPWFFSPTHFVRDILPAPDGRIYFFRHMVDTLYVYDPRSGLIDRKKMEKPVQPLDLFYESALLGLFHGRLMCALDKNGLLQMTVPQRGKTETHSQGQRKGSSQTVSSGQFAFPDRDGTPGQSIVLAGEKVTCALGDEGGNLWIGTRNGLYKFPAANNYFREEAIDPEHPARKFEAGNIDLYGDRIFVGTEGAGFFFRRPADAAWTNKLWSERPGRESIWNITNPSSQDSCWVGTQSGLCWWNPRTDSHGALQLDRHPSPLDSFPVTTQWQDSKGLIWMGVGWGHGIAVYDPAIRKLRWYTHNDPDNPLPIHHPTALVEDEEGNMWMGAQNGRGLVKWQRSSGRFSLFPPAYNTAFDNGDILSLWADRRGHVWVGTSGGLVKWDIKDNHRVKIEMSTGLSANFVYALCGDDSGHLWIGTHNGLDCLDLSNDRLTQLGVPGPFSDNAIVGLAYDRLRDKIYCTTLRHFITIQPGSWLNQQATSRMLLTSVSSDGQPIGIDPEIRLPHHQGNIGIGFTGINLSNGSQNSYYYQLEGAGKDWIGIGRQRQVSFSNLAPGRYVFHVKARAEGGGWSLNEARLVFVVKPPFWKTTAFVILLSLLILSGFYILYRYRIRQLLRLQQVRDRIATDLHDDIGSTLTNIHILSELSRANITEPDKAQPFLRRISEEISNSSQALDDIVWSINTRNDSFEQIAARMRRYAAEIFDSENILYSLELDERLAPRKMKMDQRRDLYLLFKEAVNNIYKHAGAKQVRISISIEKGSLWLDIGDDGIGFDSSRPNARNGLKSMQARAARWRGDCFIESVQGKGTRIRISLPLEN